MYLSVGHKIPGCKSEEQLSTYLHIAIQHVQGAAVIHYVMIYEQQKHLVIPHRRSQTHSDSCQRMSNSLRFIYFFRCLIPLQFLLLS